MSPPVLVGYDGGSSGEDALAFALRHATLIDAPVVVATVYPAPAPIGAGRVDAEWVAERRDEARVCLDRARVLVGHDRAVGGVDVAYHSVASSSAAHGLSDLVEREGAALVVVGSSARAAEGHVLAGSTANRLLHGATAPVGVAPAGTRSRAWREPPVVGVAYVDTPEARVALHTAADIAARAGAVLRVYTVVAGEAPVLPWLIGVDAEHAFSATARESFRQAVDEALAALPTPATSVLLIGDVVDTLAGLEEVDVLFCGSRGYGPVRSVLLGGVSSRLMRRSRNPLVIVPR